MATMVLTDAYVSINSVDLSDHVRSVTINYEAEVQDETAMGDDTRTNLGGLKNWTLEVEFLQDYAASEVDATLFSLVGSTTAISVRPTSSAVSSTNPNFNGTGLVSAYNPVGGSVGELHVTSCTIVSAGTLSRSTS